jgi:lambda family phage portal protein
MINLIKRVFKKRHNKDLKGIEVRNFQRWHSNSQARFNFKTGTIDYNQISLINKAREAELTTAIVPKYLQMLEDNVLGPKGFILQSKAKKGNDENDDEINLQIEKAFNEWCESKSCHVTEELNFRDFCALALRSVVRDGECFIRPIEAAQNSFKFSLQVLESEYLDHNLNHSVAGNRYVRAGIEFNEWGKALYYYMHQYHPQEIPHLTRQSAYTKKIEASQIIHLYKKNRPSQIRGITWLAPVLESLSQLDSFMDAWRIRARIAASQLGFFTSNKNELLVGTRSEIFQNSNKTAQDKENKRNRAEDEIFMEVEAGEYKQLPEGWDFKPHNIDALTDNGIFVKTMLRNAATGLNVNYNTLSGDLENVNYSSLRAGAQADREYYKSLQAWFISNFLNPIFEKWLKMAILAGKIDVPFSRYNELKKVKWVCRGFSYIDPVKDIRANIEAHNHNFKTLSEILAENGKDFDETIEQIKKEKNILLKNDLISEVVKSGPK